MRWLLTRQLRYSDRQEEQVKPMDQKSLAKVTGLIGIGLVATFTIGLAKSIATGFAGFWGGLPVIIIVLIVLSMAVYDYWDECWRKH